MKCCFCGAELDDAVEHLVCPNTDCKFGCNPMTTFVWQALIDGKKAQDALKAAENALEYISSGESAEWEDSTVTAMKALKQITSIITQEKENG